MGGFVLHCIQTRGLVMRTSEIRQRFIDFYEAENYRLLPRASMLDDSIPMSFVMSAGLVQVEQSLAKENTRDGNKYVLVQDCFRHFDLDKVGTDNLHLSIFEMPGAFEFGSGGKKVDTVKRMWRLATSVLGISKERLWASYFGGGTVLQDWLPPDSTVYQAWLDVGMSSDRIVDLGVSGNYWIQGKGIDDVGATRKCGPNTELFYDRGDDLSCGMDCQPGCSCGRFVEFSNSLFIKYQIDENNNALTPLADPFSETVIGTERVAMILQGEESVFDIGSYSSIIDTIHRFVDVNGYDNSRVVASERVIADHMKALYLLVADGAPPPGKHGRNRIIKLLVRGVLTRQLFLNIASENFISDVLNCISDKFQKVSDSYAIQKRTEKYCWDQRKRFLKTVERGHGKLLKMVEDNGGSTLSGAQVIELEKVVGLPSLLTAKALWERGLQFQEHEYWDELKQWKHNLLVRELHLLDN
jgi:alanyl-tRNA synthetase